LRALHLELFYETIVSKTFYEFIKNEKQNEKWQFWIERASVSHFAF